MALINRMTRLFKADIHSVLDRIEEPESQLKQAVREMQEDVIQLEQKIKLLKHEKSLLTRKQTDLSDSLQQINEELDICFASEKEELARGLVQKKLETERCQKHLAVKTEGLAKSVSELDNLLKENRLRLNAMRQKLEFITEKEKKSVSEDGQPGYEQLADFVIRDEEIEVAFLKEKQRRQKK